MAKKKTSTHAKQPRGAGFSRQSARTPSRASSQTATTQSVEFYAAMQEIVRRFQFRDVNAICEFGISLTECHALELIEGNGPMLVNDLAAALRLDKSTVSRTIARLVERKLISRRANQGDARAVRVGVTAKGRRLYEQIREDAVCCYQELLATVPHRGREEIVRSIAAVAEVLRRRGDTS